MRATKILHPLAALLLLAACEMTEEVSPSPTPAPIITLPDSVRLINMNSSGYGQVTLTGLNNEDVFLIKVNMGTSGTAVHGSVVSADTSGAAGITPSAEGKRVPAGTIITSDGQTLTRYERHWPLVLPDGNAPALMRSITRAASVYTEAVQEGATHTFYVDVTETTKIATLKKIGTYCKVWVVTDNFTTDADNNDNKVTQEQINELAAKFDAIYPLETRLLGYEYGGGGGNGGADGDPKIQILIYDIDDDFSEDQSGGVLGYFYSGDEYNTVSCSNKAEIFYLDSGFLDRYPDTMYSTLIHEFNHMINYNVKVLQTGRIWETWHTEMLSMLAEDVIGPLVGIPADNPGHVINMRIPNWLNGGYALAGPMRWVNNDSVLLYYASNYAFGAYLVRNFGGPAFLSHNAKSPNSGQASLRESLSAVGGGVSLEQAVARFGEALVYSGPNMPADVYSFDKTVSGTIDVTEYTFTGFNIWNIQYSVGELSHMGPQIRIYDDIQTSIPIYASQLFSRDDWLNKFGELTVTVMNGNPNVRYHLLTHVTLQ
jgi:hypothetical protein